jgi:hypothetical protein
MYNIQIHFVRYSYLEICMLDIVQNTSDSDFTNSRTFPIESLVHDSGRTLVCTEYGYPKGSPNTNS